MIPKNFYEWHKCITEDCCIQLTPNFVQERIKVFENDTHAETIKFKQLYGVQQLQMTISWYKEAAHLIKE